MLSEEYCNLLEWQVFAWGESKECSKIASDAKSLEYKQAIVACSEEAIAESALGEPVRLSLLLATSTAGTADRCNSVKFSL